MTWWKKKESPKEERAVKPVILLPSEKWVLKIGFLLIPVDLFDLFSKIILKGKKGASPINGKKKSWFAKTGTI